MFLIPINKFSYVCVVFILFVLSGVVLGDSVTTRDSVSYGQIIAIDKDDVTFAEGCDKNNIKKFLLKRVKRMQRNSQCYLPPKPDVVGGFDLDTCLDENNENQLVYVVNFGKRRKVYASELELKEDGKLIIHIINSNEKLSGPIEKVEIISHTCIEKKEIPTKPEFPKEFSKF